MASYDLTPTSVSVGGAGNLPATNELPVDMYKKTLKAFPSLTPLTVILTRLGEDSAHNFRIDWNEENVIPTSVEVATDLASSGTALATIGNAKTLVAGTSLFNPRTFDIATVNSTPTTDIAATITRGAAGTTAAAWKAKDVLHVMPPIIAEDDETYRPISVKDDNVYNYIQLIRMQYALTRTEDAMSTHFGGRGSTRQKLKGQKYREFREKWEKLIYFGGRSSSGTAPTSYRTMGGLTHYLKDGTLYKDFDGLFTKSGLDNFLGDYSDQNPDAGKIMMACSPNVIRKINDFAEDKVRISTDAKTYGLDITTYRGGPLTVDLVPLPLLNDPVTRGWGWLLDTERLQLRYLDRPAFYGDAKGVGQSEKIYDLYRTATSLMVANESRHAMFVGATL